MKRQLLLLLLVSSPCLAMHKPAATNQIEDDGYVTEPDNWFVPVSLSMQQALLNGISPKPAPRNVIVIESENPPAITPQQEQKNR